MLGLACIVQKVCCCAPAPAVSAAARATVANIGARRLTRPSVARGLGTHELRQLPRRRFTEDLPPAAARVAVFDEDDVSLGNHRAEFAPNVFEPFDVLVEKLGDRLRIARLIGSVEGGRG